MEYTKQAESTSISEKVTHFCCCNISKLQIKLQFTCLYFGTTKRHEKTTTCMFKLRISVLQTADRGDLLSKSVGAVQTDRIGTFRTASSRKHVV
jgi:hypothetical protein